MADFNSLFSSPNRDAEVGVAGYFNTLNQAQTERRKSLMELMMRNAQIKAQLEADKEKNLAFGLPGPLSQQVYGEGLDQWPMRPGVPAQFGKEVPGTGITVGQDLPAGPEQYAPIGLEAEKLLDTRLRAKQAADQKGGRSREFMSGEEANKFLQGRFFDPKASVGRLQYQAAAGRQRAEKGPVGLQTADVELESALKNIDDLIQAREDIDKGMDIPGIKKKYPLLSWTGPVMGRIGPGLGRLTGGNVPGTGDAMNWEGVVGLMAPGVAKGAGHVGNLNLAEVAAAVQAIGNLSVNSKTAVDKLKRLRGMMATKKNDINKQFPGMARQRNAAPIPDWDEVGGAPYSPTGEDPLDAILNKHLSQ